MADPHASVSDRLRVLVDSGHFVTWPQIAAQLAHEGYAPRLIAAVGRDRKRRRQISARLLEVAHAIEEGQRVKVDAKRMSPSCEWTGWPGAADAEIANQPSAISLRAG
jgi:hypothetical protein